jgi:DNA repair exonuclease SbcCD ATPase subunit
MIIEQIVAENLLTYRHLALRDLPARGVIAISGKNESGKSSIGEILCFALFGRTYALGSAEVKSAVYWGALRGVATVRFALKDGARYEVSRELDGNGTTSAHLARVDAGGQTVTRGVAAVNQALVRLLGFDYEEYIGSLYLAQRELTVPHPHSTALRRISGTAAFAEARAALRAQVEQLQASLAAAVAEDQHLKAEDAAPDSPGGPILSLEQERLAAEAECRAASALMERLALEATGVIAAPQRLAQAVAALAAQGLAVATIRDWRGGVDHLGAALTACQGLAAGHGEMDATLARIRSKFQGLSGAVVAGEHLRAAAAEAEYRLRQILGREGGEEGATGLCKQQGELTEAFRQVAGHGSVARFFSLIFFLGTVALWGLWYLFNWMAGDTFSLKVLAEIVIYLPDFESLYRPWLPHAAGGMTLLFFGVRKIATKRGRGRQNVEFALSEVAGRIERGRADLARLEGIDQKPLAETLALLAEVTDEGLRAACAAALSTPLASLVDGEAVAALTTSLVEEAARVRAGFAAIAREKSDQQGAGSIRLQACEDRGKELQASINEARKQMDRLAALRLRAAEIRPILEEGQRRIKAHELAAELLRGAAAGSFHEFIGRVRERVSQILPKLTQNAYQHVKLHGDLGMEIFSEAKGDFVRIKELSSGTERQILLALRLSLAQELAVATGGQGACQFAFLDEPFAFFDQDRIAGALAAGQEIAAQVAQIFCVSQQFPADFEFALHICCLAKQGELVASGKGLS